MEDNDNVARELESKTQDLLVTNNNHDLDKDITESFMEFYKVYSVTPCILDDIKSGICKCYGDNLSDSIDEEVYSIVAEFLIKSQEEIRTIIDTGVQALKGKQGELSAEEFGIELNQAGTSIVNKILDYILNSIDNSDKDVNSNDEQKKESLIEKLSKVSSQNPPSPVEIDRIKNTLMLLLAGKVMNVIRENFRINIQKIRNKSQQNIETAERIGEITQGIIAKRGV